MLAVPAVGWCRESSLPREEALTLDQALAMAMEKNRLVRSARLEADKAENKVAEARTNLLPILSFDLFEMYALTSQTYTFERGLLGTIPNLGPIPRKSTRVDISPDLLSIVSLTATQPISQLYKIALGIRQAVVLRDMAREELRARRQSATYEVKKAYYGILQSQSALGAAEDTIKLDRELDRLTDDYLAQGKVLKADSLGVKSRLARSEHEAFSLRNALATRKEQLNDLLGRDVKTRFRVSPVGDLTLFEADLDAAEARAVEQRPEVREARLKVKQAEYEKKIKKAEYIPDLSLMANYFSPVGSRFIPDNVAVVGLYLRWEFFDWGRKQKELVQRADAVEQAHLALREAESKVVVDLNAQYRTVREARSLLGVCELAREAAREQLRVSLERYSRDAALVKDVLQAQAALSEANHRYEESLLAYWTGRADFERALGEE